VSAYDVSRVMRVVKHPNGELTRTPHDVALQLPIVPAVSGELRTYDILLPFLPPSKNEYDRLPGEWKSGVKRKWYRWVREECEAQDMPRNVPKIGLMAWLTFPNRGTVRDPQNYSSTLWNFVPDALQLSRGRGYPMLPDDGHAVAGGPAGAGVGRGRSGRGRRVPAGAVADHGRGRGGGADPAGGGAGLPGERVPDRA
jgi:hypothetical protein